MKWLNGKILLSPLVPVFFIPEVCVESGEATFGSHEQGPMGYRDIFRVERESALGEKA